MRKFTDEQLNRLLRFFRMSDYEYYDKYIADAPLEEQAELMNEFPEFMSGEGVNRHIDFENDEMFQKIMRRVG